MDVEPVPQPKDLDEADEDAGLVSDDLDYSGEEGSLEDIGDLEQETNDDDAYTDVVSETEEPDEAEEIEEEETEIKEPLRFYGNVDDTDVDDHQARLLTVLKKRNFAQEQRENPLPSVVTRTFDLALTEQRRLKLLAQFPSTVTMRKLERPYTPIDLEVSPDYEPRLPNIAQARKVKRERPERREERKDVKVMLPREQKVTNPFFVPDDIPGYMLSHEEERVKNRLTNFNVPCMHKVHGTALIQKELARRIKPYQTTNQGSISYDPMYDTIMWEAARGLNITRIQKVCRKLHANYTKHRKDVFYADYAIHARQKALEEIHEKQEAEEVALKNYEYLSNYAAEGLDVFLRETEESKNQALKLAEEKLREGIVLSEQSRHLNLEASSTKAEIAQLNENLRECKFYMQFLDSVARELMRRDEEEKYRKERRQQQIKEDLATFLQDGMTLKEAKKALKDKDKEYTVSQFRKTGKESVTESAQFVEKLQKEALAHTLGFPMAARVNSILEMLATSADQDDGFDEVGLIAELNLVDGDERTDKEELAGLVFTRPSQLLDIYLDVEEQNLSLIQHAQINEETLEAVELRIRESRRGTEGKSRRLRDIINDIEAQMQKANEHIETLNLLIDMFTGGYYDVKSQEKLMKLLRRHVNKLYRTCIGPNTAHLSSVLMLTSIEKNFEDVVRDLESIPKDVVLKISRGLEKERRDAERREQEAMRNQHKNERLARSLEKARTSKPTKGRKLAFRSRPPKVSATLVQKQLESKAEEDDWNYYFGE